MKVLAMLMGALKERGKRVLAVWIVGFVVLSFTFRAWGNGPLEGSSRLGMAASVAILALLGDVVWVYVQRRRGAHPPSGGPSNAS